MVMKQNLRREGSFHCDMEVWSAGRRRVYDSHVEPLTAKGFWISVRGKVKANNTSTSFESKSFHCFSKKPNGNNILIHITWNNWIQLLTLLILGGILHTCGDDIQTTSHYAQN